jgi:hypothetical protein
MKININDFPVDTDDYINKLLREIESLKNTVELLKIEIKTQRKEIEGLKEEKRIILNNDNPPGKCIKW